MKYYKIDIKSHFPELGRIASGAEGKNVPVFLKVFFMQIMKIMFLILMKIGQIKTMKFIMNVKKN